MVRDMGGQELLRTIPLGDGFWRPPGQTKDCPAGSLNVTNTSYVAYDAMKSGNSTEAACGKNLVGDMRIKCLEGVVSIASGFCRAPRGCAAGSLLFGTAKLTYNSMAHEQFLSRACLVMAAAPGSQFSVGAGSSLRVSA